ncbi:MAG: sugar ABC transporter ATP-binding protein [Verrucomicrobia bacterium]|nr:sugar ABC transporter ATP-binding protein [Verrucomicrobiota bacterium]
MEGMAKRFGATVALEGVDLEVGREEVLALVGENGAGKSTLMKVLSGAHQPDAGSIWLDGAPYAPANPLEARRAGVAMIYQELSLAPHLSVEDNVLLGMEPHRAGWIRSAEVRARAQEALLRLGHGEIPPERRVDRLPVAAQQLVEIARALAVGCRVLVLDEPTSSLAQADADRLFDLIRQLKSQGLAIVYISHFLDEVKQVADRIAVLRDGRKVADEPAGRMDVGAMVARMVGREVRDWYPRSARQAGDVILTIADLAGIEKPDSASLELRRGEVVGLAGLLGAGRTELLRCVFGLDAVRRGEVRVGMAAGAGSPMRRWAQGMGMLSEDRKQEGLALSMSIADNITLTRLEGLGGGGWIWPRRQASAAREWVRQLDIRCRDTGQKVAALSGGNQQKVALARLLHHDVDVLLLDEPTRGIDVAAKATVYRLIDELAAGDPSRGRKARAVLMVSSYLPELLGVCDRIAVMCRGRLGPARRREDVDEHALMLEATRLEAGGDSNRHGE